MRTNLDRLALLIERMQDAELLLDAEGERLLTRVESAHQALKVGDIRAVQLHIEQIARFLEALVATNRLALSDGRTVIQTARRILASDID